MDLAISKNSPALPTWEDDRNGKNIRDYSGNNTLRRCSSGNGNGNITPCIPESAGWKSRHGVRCIAE